jgi:hypothetical protein
MNWPESWYLYQSVWLNSTRDVHASGLSSNAPSSSSRRNLKDIFQPSPKMQGIKNPAKEWKRRQLVDLSLTYGDASENSIEHLSSSEYVGNSSNLWQVGVAFAYDDMYVLAI